MAGLILSPQTRGQIAAIALVRWQLFVNSLRTIRGRLELVSRIFMGLGIAGAGLGGSTGLAIASWYFVSHAHIEYLAIFLWIVFLFWQLFPVMATAFTETADSSNLLRFPVSYRSYFLIQMIYGSLDPATALGCLWLLGMTIGAGIAVPGLFLWTGLVLLVFALLNIFLARMIFAWVERWLAKRRTREIISVLFFILIIGFQFTGTIVNRLNNRAHPAAARLLGQALPLERLLPPGLAATAIASPALGESAKALGSLALLGTYGAIVLWLLHLRVRKQYLGENLSEGMARVAGPKAKAVVSRRMGIARRIGCRGGDL